jgi:dihydrodipicolinate synthase/N-acetylneuraminate lyase
MTGRLPSGIVPVLQTPFHESGELDFDSLGLLIEDAIASGADGFLAPVVASEVDCLGRPERERLVRFVSESLAGRVPLIVGASSADPLEARDYVLLGAAMDAAGCLIAVPDGLFGRQRELLAFFHAATRDTGLPLLIQDLQWNGPGLDVDTFLALQDELPTLAGLKIETVPAGPKYSLIRRAAGPGFFIAGGWAVGQMIEALDRGVDAMIPESSMVRVYKSIHRLYMAGNRSAAVALFRSLLPILVFTNQEIGLSIAFFKLLLQRRGILRSDAVRRPGFEWDEFNRRIADELIDLYHSVARQCDSAVAIP